MEVVYRVYSKVQYSNNARDLVVEDNFEKIFGSNVRLKDITIERTSEPVKSGEIKKHLSEDFWKKFRTWMQSIDISERGKILKYFRFKEGD